MPQIRTKGTTKEEKSGLALALMEAQARGLEIPQFHGDLADAGSLKWPTSRGGYIISRTGKVYKPTDKQRGFINSNARFSLFYGSRGSGKSAAGLQKALRKVIQGQTGAVLNPSFENFRYSTWPELREWIPWKLVVPSHRGKALPSWEPRQPFSIPFMNGARMYCKGLRDPDSARGPNINWLWYDEAGMDETGMAWKIAIASVRVGNDPQAWATTTPKGMGHWLYKFFIEQDIPQDALDAFQLGDNSDRLLIDHYHGTIEENKANLDQGFYASILANYPSGWLRSQEVLGEFANEGGKIGDRTWFLNRVVQFPPKDISTVNLIQDEAEREKAIQEEHITKRIRFWDLAATEKEYGKNANDPDETVGSLVSKSDWTQFYIENQIGGFWLWDQVKKILVNTALRDGPDVHIWIEQEPGASGKALIAEIKSLFKSTKGLENHKVFGFLPEDRVLMANDWFALAAGEEGKGGKIWLCEGAWIEKFLEQVDGFLQIRHDDRVTSVSCALRTLNPFKSWHKTPFLSL